MNGSSFIRCGRTVKRFRRDPFCSLEIDYLIGRAMGCVMFDHKELQSELCTLFAEQLLVQVDSPETDLLTAGLLDSLTLVQLLLHVERRFGFTVAIEDLDLNDFRSIDSIVYWILSRISPHCGKAQAATISLRA